MTNTPEGYKLLCVFYTLQKRLCVELEKLVEARRETCTVASKIVSIKIFRNRALGTSEGEIVGFECDSSSQTCEGRCLYRQLLEDY